MPDALESVISTLSELKRMHQLNFELLEQLDVACGYIVQHYVDCPNNPKMASLLLKAKSLLSEIQAVEPKILQYGVSRRKVTTNPWKDETDEDETEPFFTRLLYLVWGSCISTGMVGTKN